MIKQVDLYCSESEDGYSSAESCIAEILIATIVITGTLIHASCLVPNHETNLKLN